MNYVALKSIFKFHGGGQSDRWMVLDGWMVRRMDGPDGWTVRGMDGQTGHDYNATCLAATASQLRLG